MDKVEPLVFVIPKKRHGKKLCQVVGPVDHIITVQGGAEETPEKFKNGLSPVNEHNNGIIHSTMEGLKSNMKINLPIINDVNDEDQNDNPEDFETEKRDIQKNGSQAVSTNNLRDVMDLSPIYENSSDACSSHGDLRDTTENELQKNCKALNLDNNESSSATPISLSQTQSENSFEMGNLTDSLKNSMKKKKKVNVLPIVETDNTGTEITTMRLDSDCSITEPSLTEDGYVTMMGTIKRGKKKGQHIDVRLNISREELEIMEAAIVAEEYNKMDLTKCSWDHGLHVFLFTLMCLPIVACISAFYSFYIGTTVLNNIIIYLTENSSSIIIKVFLPPILILFYPFVIVTFMIGLGLYAGIAQLTFSGGANWWICVCDLEKGFYGWLCNKIGMSQCSPYEVVILTDVKPTEMMT